MSKYFDRENPLVLTTIGGRFYTVACPDNVEIPDEYFVVAGAIDALRLELGDLQYALSDVPTPEQVQLINTAYSNLLAALPQTDGKEVQSLKMQLGKAKAQIERLKGEKDG
jgi:hypothetical protein